MNLSSLFARLHRKKVNHDQPATWTRSACSNSAAASPIRRKAANSLQALPMVPNSRAGMLVKTTQSETAEVMTAMEDTTREVINRSNIANEAGVALSEIQGVSNRLAELIQAISDAAQQQANSAALRIEYGDQPEEGLRDMQNALAVFEKLGDKNFEAFGLRVAFDDPAALVSWLRAKKLRP